MARLAARTSAELSQGGSVGATAATRAEYLLSDFQAALTHLERRVPTQRSGDGGIEQVDVAWLRDEVGRWMERRGRTLR
jgi:hypothetical protein